MKVDLDKILKPYGQKWRRPFREDLRTAEVKERLASVPRWSMDNPAECEDKEGDAVGNTAGGGAKG